MAVHRGTLRAALLIGVALATFGGAAQARETTEERIARLEAALADLQSQLADLKASTAVTAASAPPRPQTQTASVTLANGRPTIASGDGQFTASFRGIFQLDGGLYAQDDPGPLATDFRRGSFGDAAENDHARDLGDGFNFRRVRLGVEGKAFGDYDYNFTYDFGGSGVEEGGKLNAAWIQYNGLGAVKVRVGAFAPVTGLEDAASNASSLFSERASVAETVRGFAGGDARTAIALLASGGRWNVSAALTGGVAGVAAFDEQVGFIGRFAYVPFKSDDALVHLGINTNLVLSPAATGPGVPGGAASPIRLRDRPELRVDGARLVDTGNIDADSLTAVGGEFGVLYRSLFVQAEYFDIGIARRSSVLPDPGFSGWYIQGSWILTGESRRYSTAAAGFDGPRPAKAFSLKNGTWGAWELAIRYSNLDLNFLETAIPAAGSIRGGEQDIFSLGLNWYVNNGITLQAGYRNVSVDRLSPGGAAFLTGSTPVLNTQVGQDLQIYSFRTQYAF
jgi:phosphate-selective porin OprO/OprP